MKRFASFLSLAVVVIAVPVFAQPMPFGGPPPFEELNLTSEQKTQIEQILKSSRERSKPLHDELKQIGRTTRQQIDGVLTADQRQQLKQLQAERFDPSS